jgi:integrase
VRRRARKPTPKRAIRDSELRELVAAIPMDGTLRDTRDRALLLTFLGGFRRSEVAAFDVADLAFDPTLGVVCTIQFSKTNQQGDPERVAIARNADPAICAVRWTEKWLQQAGIRERKAFRHILTGNRIGDELSGDGIYDAVRGRALGALCLWLERNKKDDEDVHPLRTKSGRWVVARFTDAVLDHLLQKFELPALFDPRLVGAHSQHMHA